jgi:uncharacterized repeat protein (TIGR03803 family)
MSSLIYSGNILYGTTAGTVFKLNEDGSGFTNLYNFPGGSDGLQPNALVLSGSKLYGSTKGTSSFPQFGSVFTLNTDGTGFTNLYSFSGGADGAYPNGLILLSNTLYGTTSGDDVSIRSTVFAINTDGTGFTNLHVFTQANEPTLTNSDGTNPSAELTASGSILYGTAAVGGIYGFGTVFKLNTDGTGFTNLHSFTSISSFYPYSNNDGANPHAKLALTGNTLWGTAYSGGDYGYGTVFSLKRDGTGFSTLYSFTTHSGLNDSNVDGEFPIGPLALVGSSLYGTANLGGGTGYGSIFSVSLPLELRITPNGQNVVLAWDLNVTLQSAADPTSLVWFTNLPSPVVVNGQYTVTNPISGTAQVFRLRR